jgi:hypothetical protein
MNKHRLAEAVSGLVATFLALAGFIYLLLGPTYSFAASTGASGTTSMLQVLETHIQLGAIIALFILFLAIIGVGIGAVGHSSTQNKAWKIVLLCSVIVMITGTLLGILSIGPIIAPGSFFAILALYFSRAKNSATQG